ncbi:hypothetical protein ACTFQO_17970 [Bacillus cereus group sp. MYBK29-1]|uniref:hypothetical protein n=1 Tax=Bacillus cereus group sp. MYBK29-1 TaxID=3450637 RepID=UPI003F7B07E3
MFRVGAASFLSCQFLSVSRYIRKIADIIQVAPIYFENRRLIQVAPIYPENRRYNFTYRQTAPIVK